MAEIRRRPIIGIDKNGDETVTFDAGHSISDIVRWVKGEDWYDDFIHILRSHDTSIN